MSIVPMKVNVKGHDKKALIYALLDSGSNTSFCTEDLLKQLNTKGERATLSLTTMRKSNKTTKKKKSFTLQKRSKKMRLHQSKSCRPENNNYSQSI